MYTSSTHANTPTPATDLCTPSLKWKHWRHPDWWAAARGHCRALAACSSRVHYVDCGGDLLLNPPPGNSSHAAGNITPRYLTDGVHPSGAGFERLFSLCWAPAIDGLLAGDAPPGAERV